MTTHETSRPPYARVIPIGVERRDEFLAVDQAAFMWPPEEVDPAEDTAQLEWDRTFAAETADGELAGINATYTFDLSVPCGAGGTGATQVPAAGLTWVGVHPEHRRRGVLTAMIRHHLHGLHGTREPVSVLHASEMGIYGRFGYGLATSGVRLTLGRGAPLRDVPGSDRVRTRMVAADPDLHAELVTRLYDEARLRTPGMVSRSATHVRQLLSDPKRWRKEGEPRRLLTAERDGTVTGYALLRRIGKWSDEGPAGVVQTGEVIAADGAAAHALWERILDVDLTARVETGPLPVDDPLLHLLVDTRAAKPTTGDDVWARLVDVDRALSARGYATPVDLVLDLTDDLCPWNAGRWRLTGGPEGATCTPTTDAADLALDVRELGSAWLGGVTLASLAGAGLVTEHRPGAVEAASTAFRSARAPRSTWMF